MKDEEYQCAMCGETFLGERSDDEALAECESFFGKTTPDERVIICEDCFKIVDPANHPHIVEQACSDLAKARLSK